jgi:hypothetical protein
MTPGYAALLLQRLIKRESLELIGVFNDLERQREAILAELLDRDELEAHLRTKQSVVYSQPDPDPDEQMLEADDGADAAGGGIDADDAEAGEDDTDGEDGGDGDEDDGEPEVTDDADGAASSE